jgi:glycosyltransferase involved in cell wall biosynthesis
MKINIVTTALNESDNIPDFMGLIASLRNFFDQDFQVVFVDNGSSDSTQSLLADFTALDRNLHLVTNSVGSLYADGIEAALKNSSTDYSLLVPSDMQFSLSDIKKVLVAFTGITRGGSDKHHFIFTQRVVRNDGQYKKWRGNLWRGLVTSLFGIDKSLDPASQLRIVCRDCVNGGVARNFLWDIETAVRFTKGSTKWSQVGVTFNSRLKGQSTLGTNQLKVEISAFIGLLKLASKIRKSSL